MTRIITFISTLFFILFFGFSAIAQRNPKEISLDPKLQFYRPSENELQLYFSIQTDKLLHARTAGEGTPLQAHLEITCYGFDANTLKTTWEIRKDFFKVKNKDNENWVSKLDLSDQADYEGRVVVKVEDINRNNSYTAYSNLVPERLQSQYFLALNPTTEKPNLSPHYFIGDSLIITYSNVVKDKVWLNFYDVPVPPPPPPFIENFQDETVMEVRRIEVNVSGDPIQLPTMKSQSLVEVKSDKSSDTGGLILPFFYRLYPKLAQGKNMADPLVYITTKEEYQKIQGAENPRKAVEEFWISKCKNKEQARDALSIFYSRVEESNTFFTYYSEGWKSDRGMIYIVFGKPESVTKRGDLEIWTYGREINTARLSFTFKQQRNNFSFNHFTLERNSGYKATWDLATNTWRNGRPFSY